MTGLWERIENLVYGASISEDTARKTSRATPISPEKHVAIGSVHVLNIAEMKAHAGKDWPLLRNRINLLIENVLSLRLDKHDTYFRCDDGIYGICFSSVGLAEAELVCARIREELLRGLLGPNAGRQSPDEPTPQFTTSVLRPAAYIDSHSLSHAVVTNPGRTVAPTAIHAEALRLAAIGSAAVDALIATGTASDIESGERILVHMTELGNAMHERSKACWRKQGKSGTPTPTALARIAVQSRKKLAAWRHGGVKPSIQNARAEGELSWYPILVTRRKLVGLEIVRDKTAPAINGRGDYKSHDTRCVQALVAELRKDIPPHKLLGARVHATTILRTGTRALLHTQLSHIPPEIRGNTVLELALPARWSTPELHASLEFLFPWCRAVILRLAVVTEAQMALCATLSTPLKARICAAGIHVNAANMTPAVQAEHMARAGLHSWISGMDDPGKLQEALGAGFDYMEGAMIGDDAKAPSGIRPFHVAKASD